MLDKLTEILNGLFCKWSVCGTDVKLHYCPINGVPHRNDWKKTAPLMVQFLRFLNAFVQIQCEKIFQLFWKNGWCQIFGFVSNFHSDLSLSLQKLSESDLENRKLAMNRITKIYVSKRVLFLKTLFLKVQYILQQKYMPQETCCCNSIEGSFARKYIAFNVPQTLKILIIKRCLVNLSVFL